MAAPDNPCSGPPVVGSASSLPPLPLPAGRRHPLPLRHRVPQAMAAAKQNYRVRQRLEVFYTGGSVRLSADGRLLACACADEVKVVDAASGTVVQTLPGVRANPAPLQAAAPLAGSFVTTISRPACRVYSPPRALRVFPDVAPLLAARLRHRTLSR